MAPNPRTGFRTTVELIPVDGEKPPVRSFMYDSIRQELGLSAVSPFYTITINSEDVERISRGAMAGEYKLMYKEGSEPTEGYKELSIPTGGISIKKFRNFLDTQLSDTVKAKFENFVTPDGRVYPVEIGTVTPPA